MNIYDDMFLKILSKKYILDDFSRIFDMYKKKLCLRYASEYSKHLKITNAQKWAHGGMISKHFEYKFDSTTSEYELLKCNFLNNSNHIFQPPHHSESELTKQFERMCNRNSGAS